MTARRKLVLVFTSITAVAAVAIAVVCQAIASELVDGDARRAFQSLVDETAVHVREIVRTPDSFTEGNETSLEQRLAHSRDVISQELSATGVTRSNDPDFGAIPVYSVDREVSDRAEAGEVEQRDYTTRDGEVYRVAVVSLGGGRGAVRIAQSTTRTTAVLAGLAWRLAGAVAVLLVLVGLACSVAARRITRGLERLAGVAEEVASTGRLDVVVPKGGPDEVARLGAAFDSVLVRLAGAREDQRRLVQDANHELRTPLTSLRTNVSVLKRMDELSSESRGQLIEDLDGEARELSHLVAELMEFSSERRVDEEFGAVDLPGLGDRVATRARRRSGREVLVDAEGVVTGRARGLERALANLVDNALKFSEGPVELVLRPNRIRVLDRGPGVAPEDRSRIFDRFHRATAARSLPGSGLGLAIVHEVATTHGGAVFARERPGGGADIGFTL